MARDQYIAGPLTEEYQEISSGAVSGNFAIQARGGAIELYFTSTGTNPDKSTKGLIIEPLMGVRTLAISDLVQTSGLNRIHAKCVGQGNSTEVWIDHA